MFFLNNQKRLKIENQNIKFFKIIRIRSLLWNKAILFYFWFIFISWISIEIISHVEFLQSWILSTIIFQQSFTKLCHCFALIVNFNIKNIQYEFTLSKCRIRQLIYNKFFIFFYFFISFSGITSVSSSLHWRIERDERKKFIKVGRTIQLKFTNL